MSMSSQEVFDALFAVHERAVKSLSVDTELMDHQGQWRGLGFILGDHKVVSSMDELTEVMPKPERVTRVSGAPKWLVGLCNYHGEILPVTDLQVFLGNEPVISSNTNKVLVVKNLNRYYGFLVQDVLGIQYFPMANINETGRGRDGLDFFCYENVSQTSEQELWPIMSMAALVHDGRFLMKSGAE